MDQSPHRSDFCLLKSVAKFLHFPILVFTTILVIYSPPLTTGSLVTSLFIVLVIAVKFPWTSKEAFASLIVS